MGEGAINLFKIGARMVLDVTVGAEAPILKRLIAVNTFVSPWGLEILGSDFSFGVGWGLGWGGWGKGQSTFSKSAPV